MELILDLMMYLAIMIAVLCVAMCVCAFYEAYTEERARQKAQEKRDKRLELNWNIMTSSAMVGMSQRLDIVERGRRFQSEVARDAHKRIDDNRKLMFIMNECLEERIRNLEDELEAIKRAKRGKK